MIPFDFTNFAISSRHSRQTGGAFLTNWVAVANVTFVFGVLSKRPACSVGKAHHTQWVRFKPYRLSSVTAAGSSLLCLVMRLLIVFASLGLGFELELVLGWGRKGGGMVEGVVGEGRGGGENLVGGEGLQNSSDSVCDCDIFKRSIMLLIS